MNWIRSTVAALACTLTAATLAQTSTVEITAYNQKGEMGKISLYAPDAFHLESDTALSWNNRRYRLSEKITLDASGYPVSVEITGISTFGAPIEEKFSRTSGKAEWQSLKESGSSKTGGFYLPADMVPPFYVQLLPPSPRQLTFCQADGPL